MYELFLTDLAEMPRDEAEAAIRARTQVVPLGDGILLARVLGRYKMFLRADDRGFAAHVMLDGYWESWLTLFFVRFLKPGMVAIDVGANFGYYTCIFAEAVGATGRVIAFEPVPSTAHLLRQTVQLNGFAAMTTIEEAAAADFVGHVQMFVPPGEPKNALVTDLDLGPKIDVRATTLDSACLDLPRIDIIKIDAEGAEQSILEGMQEVLARHRPALLIEFNAARYADPATFLAKLLAGGRTLNVIGFDGHPAPIKAETVLNRRPFDDWLLYIHT